MSPRERFQKTEHAKAWANLSASAAFVTATDFAMLQTVTNLAVPVDHTTAMANFYRLEGAEQFRRVLAGLGEVKVPATRGPVGQLNHDV